MPQCWVGGPNLQHHADEVVDPDVVSVCLLNQREQLLSKLDCLSLSLPCVKKLFSPEMNRIGLEENRIKQTGTCHEPLNVRVDRGRGGGLPVNASMEDVV